jgi:glyoxylase-like metal-dependent hydrolase (beta-lactamase superfamily II)
MKFKNKFFLVTLLMVMSIALTAGTINGLPVHVKKLSDNAIRLWVGDYVSSTAVCALKTDKGIVVIDTTQCPEVDKQFRKIIAKKFGRNDFVMLINTHEHGDHTRGNAVYSDCKIIAHEECAKGMQISEKDRKRVIAWMEEYLPKLKKQLGDAKEGSDEYKKLKEQIVVRKMVLKTLKKGIETKIPTKTFKEKMVIPMGNMTLELYAMGGLHSASDIFIFVPEEKLLFTGDIMADTWLTDTPGCLQSFGGRVGIKRDLPVLLKNWKSLIARKDEIKQYIPGHWNGELSEQGFVDRYKYLTTLTQEVKKAHKEGKGLEKVLADLKMESRFPKLHNTPGFTVGFVHNNNIVSLWSEITGAKSASEALASIIDKKGLEAAMKKFNPGHLKGSKSANYYYLESDFNRLGYRYMNHKKYPEAISVFELNVKMYPESWNVYDSLGEAYLKAGKKEMAMKAYKKAFKLNPQKTEGQKKQYQVQLKILNKLKEEK